jgi:hypothetical protein
MNTERMMNIEDLILNAKSQNHVIKGGTKKDWKKMFVNFGGLPSKKKERVLPLLCSFGYISHNSNSSIALVAILTCPIQTLKTIYTKAQK